MATLQKIRSGHDFPYPPIPAKELLSGLSENGRKNLNAIMQSTHFNADEQIFTEGDEPRNIYLLNRGRANFTREHRSHISSSDCPVTPDQLFGVTEVLAGQNFENGLRTVTDCEIDVIDRDDFVAFLRSHPTVCYRLATVVSCLYQNAVTHIKTQ